MSGCDENDLPLMANTQDVLIRHFIMDLTCDIEDKTFRGNLTIFLDLSKTKENKQVFSIQEYQQALIGDESCSYDNNLDVRSEDTNESFQLVLDCCDIEIESVEEVCSSRSDLENLFKQPLHESASEYRELSMSPGKPLMHSTDKWSLTISDPGRRIKRDFPPVIRINYHTTKEGSSLRWVPDQDGNMCVYTAGMWINNRSFLPCQEYGSLSTWQAYICVRPPYHVFMSGDEVEITQVKCDGSVEYYYRSIMPLPSFTMALAVVHWQCKNLKIEDDKLNKADTETETASTLFNEYLDKICTHKISCVVPFSQNSILPCRVIAPSSIIDKALSHFQKIFSKYSTAVQKILGPSPFRRMDIVLYPPSCQDMAMCNPNLLFVSQSWLTEDLSMSSRLGHELSHYWFGLFLGARDWTEEWLSEGFATYVEDLIHARAMAWNQEEAAKHLEISAHLKYTTLCSELSHTDADLQTLRPNKDKGLEASLDDNSSVMYIKNGVNPNKLFTQVHYLKGYFLLRWLGLEIGIGRFQTVFLDYICQYHGQMVTSKDFLNLVFNKFPELEVLGHSVESICRDWLDNSGLPERISFFKCTDDNDMYSNVLLEYEKWLKLDRHYKRMRSAAKRPKTINADYFLHLDSQQLLILMNSLLKKSSFCGTTLNRFHKEYHVELQNAEIQHRWFEMVVKYRLVSFYKALGLFLINHQAMGVYLYGEMMISMCPRLRNVAETSFNATKSNMEPTTRNIVHSMIYGNEYS